MADINTAFVQQIFHILKRKRKPDVHHHRQADELGRRLEVLEWVAFCHSGDARCTTCTLQRSFL